jgi:hypothetical protein
MLGKRNIKILLGKEFGRTHTLCSAKAPPAPNGIYLVHSRHVESIVWMQLVDKNK